MPRVAQAFKNRGQRITDNLSSDIKMPDSSAGDSPRTQPAKPVRASITPRALLFRNNLTDDRDNDNVETNDDNKSTFIKPSNGSTPKTAKFTPKRGGLAEAAMEVSKTLSPVVQRSSKWKTSVDTKHDAEETKLLPVNKFYPGSKSSPRVGLSERDLNAKINKTSSSYSSPSPRSKLNNSEFKFPIDDKEETDNASSKNPEVIEITNDTPSTEVSLPERLEPHKIGLQNRGNTCYLNSTVQALVGLPMVVTDATNLQHAVSKLNINLDNVRLVLPFTGLCVAQSQGHVARTNNKAVEVKQDMEQLDNQFAGHKMQDANEFLCRFMDELRENIGKVFNDNGDGKELVVTDDFGVAHNLTNLVDTNFQYEKEEQFECCNCKHKSSTKFTDVNFFLDLSDASLNSSVSIQQLVEQTQAPEVIEKRCDDCGAESATATTKLVSLPKVMLLYLKRYKYLGPVGGGTMTTSSRKVTRLVDIPQTVCLEKMVSDNVSIPDSVLSPCLNINSEVTTDNADTTQMVPTTPVKNAPIPLPYEGVGTPIKFKGKTEEEIAKLSDEEQTEYLLYISQKEALTSNGREVVLVNEDEDEDLKAALEASLLDVANESTNNGYESDSEQKENKMSSRDIRTPPRKRQISVTSSDAGDTPPPKLARHSGGVFSQSTESLTRAPTPSPDKKSPSSSSSPDKKQSWKKSFHRPETKGEEEADLLRALELSTQEINATSDTDENNGAQQVPESTEDIADDDDEVVEGPTEYCYKLSSIVSHFGASTTAGHYVADVYRFDAGGWFRYDDTVVTETNDISVRKGSNRANGYIFMYVHTPLWDQCNVKYNKNLNNNNTSDPLQCDSSV